MSKYVLNIDKEPFISTYADSAYQFSLIRKDLPYFDDFICDNPIQLFYNNDDFSTHSVDMLKYSYCTNASTHQRKNPLLDVIISYKYAISQKSLFKDVLINLLENNYCMVVEAEQYYLPERRGYQTKKNIHSNMIFGCSEDFEYFDIIGYDDKLFYKSITVHFDELYEAFSNTDDTSFVYCLSLKNTDNYTVNWEVAASDIYSYINSGLKDNFLSNCGNIRLGLNVMRKICDVIEYIKNDEFFADMRIFSLLKEHKKLISKKYEHFKIKTAQSNILEIEDMSNILNENFKLAELSLNSLLKFRVTKNKLILDDVIGYINTIIRNEENVLPVIADDMRKYNNKLFGLKLLPQID